ncbi:hypothetical protein SAMN05660226_03525 [Parapedobacter luteus]|uniref:Uncharacterized protein n=1 Tax=Parapedobacter luteus TaxID=623280 RepID=A0A1T5ET33_9SPHI|nr:hypothetical protein SAMN05660226_03525 [Parapedobacter luteus]
MEACLRAIEKKLGWGDSSDWTGTDFQQLSDRIYEATKVMLSASTLKRVWGRVKHDGKPATSTLDTLAAFLGYENWRSFVVAQQQAAPMEPPAKLGRKKRLLRWGLVIVALVSIGFATYYRGGKEDGGGDNEVGTVATASPDDYRFSSEPVTRGIPNSVIFTYDASRAQIDSVFIQQSWDPMRQEQVAKDGHKHTSVYYEPGFYIAKLLVGQQVVKEHPLLIPSNGWLGMINRAPRPIYLKPADYLHPDHMGATTVAIEANQVSLTPDPPMVKYYNVGNFEPVSIADFSFSARVRNDYAAGNNACQFSQVMLITDGMPISLLLSSKGCVSELALMGGGRSVSGKHEDLSAFGVDLSDWVTVGCRSVDGKLVYEVNGSEAYVLPLGPEPVRIVGMMFLFVGTGSVQAVRLQEGDDTAYRAF